MGAGAAAAEGKGERMNGRTRFGETFSTYVFVLLPHLYRLKEIVNI